MVFFLFYDYLRYVIYGIESYNYFKLGWCVFGGCICLILKNVWDLFLMVDELGKGWILQFNCYMGWLVWNKLGGYVMNWGYQVLVVIEEDGMQELIYIGFMYRDDVFVIVEFGVSYVIILF